MVRRLVGTSVICFLVLLACTGQDATLPTSAAKPAPEQHPLLAAVPIYDSTGEPDITFVSMDVQLTDSGSFAGIPRSDIQLQRYYHQQAVWQDPTSEWDMTSTFASPDQPFGSSVPPVYDVARVHLNLGTGGPEVFDRAGNEIVPANTRAQLITDATGVSYRAVALDSGGISTNALSQSGTGFAPPGQEIASRRRAAIAEEVLINHATSAHMLAELRREFRETRGPNGALRFTQKRGNVEVDITFDPVRGTIEGTEVRDNGRLRSTQKRSYADTPEGLVLAAVTTTLYTANGAPRRQFTQRYSNVAIR